MVSNLEFCTLQFCQASSCLALQTSVTLCIFKLLVLTSISRAHELFKMQEKHNYLRQQDLKTLTLIAG